MTSGNGRRRAAFAIGPSPRRAGLRHTAVLTHLRARNYALAFPGAFLALAVGAFVLSLA
ncbi:hypothetical protein [Pseudonocardia sp. DLS-67]